MPDFILVSQNLEEFNITATITYLRKARQSTHAHSDTACRGPSQEASPGLSSSEVHPREGGGSFASLQAIRLALQ